MAVGDSFGPFIRMRYERGRAFSDFENDTKSATQRAKRDFEGAFGDIRRIVDSALSRPRNAAGALDLNVDGLRRATQQAEAYAIASREVANALAAQARVEGEGQAALRLSADAAAKAATVAERRAADMRVEIDLNRRVQDELSKTTSGTARLAATQQQFSSGLNAIRSSLDPMIPVLQRLRQDLGLIDQAQQSGAISAQYAATLSGQLREKYQEQAAAVRTAETAQERLNREVLEFRATIDPAARAQLNFNRAMAEANRLRALGAISADELAAAERRVRAAQTSLGGAQRQGAIQIGQQLQDISVGFASGQNPSTIFAQQLPQLALALQQAGSAGDEAQSTLSGIASFLSGPWGIALTVATPLIFLFGSKLLEAGESADELAGKTLTLSEAMDRNRFSTEQATQALLEYNRAQESAIESTSLEIERRVASNLARIQETVALRESLLARIEEASFLESRARGRGDGRTAFQFGQAESAAQSALQAAQERLAQARRTLQNQLIEQAGIQADLANDPIARINDQYDRMADAARQAARGNRELLQSLTQTLSAIERQRRASIDAQRDSQRAERQGVRTDAISFGRPVDGGRQTSGYGPRRSPGGIGSTNHAGVDYAVPIGTRVNAAAAGTVIEVGNAPGYGRFVIVDHGAGTTTRYAHLLRATAQRGDQVQAGEQIALSGNSGRSTGPHLHFEVRRNGRPVNPNGRFPVDEVSAQRAAARAQRDAERLEQALDRITEGASRMRGQFDQAPRDIDRASAAVIDLNQLIRDAQQRLEEGGLGAEQVAQLRAALSDATFTRDALIPEFLRRPVTDLIRQTDQENELQRLRANGNEAAAEALEFQYDLMQRLGVENEAQLQTELRRRGVSEADHRGLLERLDAQRQITAEAERAYRLGTNAAAQLEVIEGISSSIDNLFTNLPSQGRGAIPDLFRNISSQFNGSFGRSLAERFFGNAFRELEEQINPRIAAERRVVDSANELGLGLKELDLIVRNVGNSLAGRSSADTVGIDGIGDQGKGDIIVSGRRSGGAGTTSIFARAIAAAFEPIFGRGSQIATALGRLGEQGLQGAFYGQSAAGLIFGQRGSSAGAGIGGAIGNVIGEKVGKQFGESLGQLASFAGPLGSIVGGLAGSLVGGLFRKSKTGVATIGGVEGSLAISSFSGNSRQFRESAGQGGDSVISTIERIAQALGANVDAGRGAVSIGLRDGNYRVDTSGRGNTRTKKGAIDFGDDAEAAIRFAVMDLIKDGVLTGLKATTQRIIQSGKDIDTALQKALDFESVFRRLKEYRDPVGAALDALNLEFTRLKKIFDDNAASAAEYADLEALYGIERNRAVKEAGERITASLRGLFDELTVGNDALSLRTRQAQALANYNPLAERVRAGDTTAYDAFAEAARQLLDLDRQISGSGRGYFDRLREITELTKARIDAEANIASISANGGSPFNSNGSATVTANDNAPVVAAINDQTAQLLAGLGGMTNAIVAAAIQNSGGGGNQNFTTTRSY